LISLINHELWPNFHTTDIHPQLPTQLPSASHPHIQVEFQKGKPICQNTETPFRTEQVPTFISMDKNDSHKVKFPKQIVKLEQNTKKILPRVLYISKLNTKLINYIDELLHFTLRLSLTIKKDKYT